MNLHLWSTENSFPSQTPAYPSSQLRTLISLLYSYSHENGLMPDSFSIDYHNASEVQRISCGISWKLLASPLSLAVNSASPFPICSYAAVKSIKIFRSTMSRENLCLSYNTRVTKGSQIKPNNWFHPRPESSRWPQGKPELLKELTSTYSTHISNFIVFPTTCEIGLPLIKRYSN